MLITPTIDLDLADNPLLFAYWVIGDLNATNNSHHVKLTMCLVSLYLGSNTVLKILNIYRFMKGGSGDEDKIPTFSRGQKGVKRIGILAVEQNNRL
jgi:hypothetical protein